MDKAEIVSRRSHMATRQLLILLVEGVLADVCKQHFFDTDPRIPLYIRPGLLNGIKALISSFQVALVSYMSRERLHLIIKYFADAGCKFDAVYDRTDLMERPLTPEKINWLQDYTKIYQDFQIKFDEVGKRVLMVSCVNLDNQELEVREGKALVYQINTGRPYLVPAVPLPYQTTELPLIVVVPNPRSQLQFDAVPMDALVRVIRELAKSGTAGWRRGFVQLQRYDVKKLETDIYQGPDTRCNYSLPEQDSGVCKGCIHRFVVICGSRVGTLSPYEKVPDFSLVVDIKSAVISSRLTVVPSYQPMTVTTGPSSQTSGGTSLAQGQLPSTSSSESVPSSTQQKTSSQQRDESPTTSGESRPVSAGGESLSRPPSRPSSRPSPRLGVDPVVPFPPSSYSLLPPRPSGMLKSASAGDLARQQFSSAGSRGPSPISEGYRDTTPLRSETPTGSDDEGLPSYGSVDSKKGFKNLFRKTDSR